MVYGRLGICTTTVNSVYPSTGAMPWESRHKVPEKLITGVLEGLLGLL